MSARREIWEVARRELVERWRSRAMRISFVLCSCSSWRRGRRGARRTRARPRTTSASSARARRAGAGAAARGPGRRPQTHASIACATGAAAERAVRDGDVDVAIVDGRLIVKAVALGPRGGRRPAGRRPRSAVDALRAAGLTQQQALETLAAASAAGRRPRAGDRDESADRDAGGGVLILFAALVVYGQAVASSVTEEKSSRVIELLLTSVSPRRLLAGKVLGVGALGVAQVDRRLLPPG